MTEQEHIIRGVTDDVALNRRAFEIACEKVRGLSNGERITQIMRNRIAALVLDDIASGMADAELIGCHVAHRLSGHIDHLLGPGAIRIEGHESPSIARLFRPRALLKTQR